MSVWEFIALTALLASALTMMFPRVHDFVDRVRDRRVLVDTITVIILSTVLVSTVLSILYAVPIHP